MTVNSQAFPLSPGCGQPKIYFQMLLTFLPKSACGALVSGVSFMVFSPEPVSRSVDKSVMKILSMCGIRKKS